MSIIIFIIVWSLGVGVSLGMEYMLSTKVSLISDTMDLRVCQSMGLVLSSGLSTSIFILIDCLFIAGSWSWWTWAAITFSTKGGAYFWAAWLLPIYSSCLIWLVRSKTTFSSIFLMMSLISFSSSILFCSLSFSWLWILSLRLINLCSIHPHHLLRRTTIPGVFPSITSSVNPSVMPSDKPCLILSS